MKEDSAKYCIIRAVVRGIRGGEGRRRWGLLSQSSTEQRTLGVKEEKITENRGGYCDQCKCGQIKYLANHQRKQNGNREILMCREPCQHKTTQNEDMM